MVCLRRFVVLAGLLNRTLILPIGNSVHVSEGMVRERVDEWVCESVDEWGNDRVNV